jgi:hypothetical protein
MSRGPLTALLICVMIVSAGSLLSSCARRSEQAKATQEQPRAESAPSAATSPAPSPTPPTVRPANEPPAPPKPGEVQEVVARVFGKVANPDTSLSTNFVVGDFNGDGSEDLAVAVKADPAQLGEINNEMANWTLEDPKLVSIPGQAKGPRPPGKPVHAEKGDSLLAIIHGFGPQGWRNAEARQTFLLKNAVGNSMQTETATVLRHGKERQKLPPVRGDAIRQTLGGKAGIIFWTGAKYAWYSAGVG